MAESRCWAKTARKTLLLSSGLRADEKVSLLAGEVSDRCALAVEDAWP